MRVLVVSPRYPESRGKGDQNRAFAHVRGLAARHDVVVVTAGAPSSERAGASLQALAEVHAVPLSTPARLAGALGAVARGRPAQTGWMSPRALTAVAAAQASRVDVTLVVTIRGLTERLPGRVVLDHVDALSRAMTMRARAERNPLLRLAARVEARLLRRHEARCLQWLAAQSVVAAADAAVLPGPPEPVVIPQGWEGPLYEDPPGHRRDIDVIFTGAMRFPPNREAARRLANSIAPRLRAVRPGVRVCIAGRAASSLRLRGVEVASDVDDLQSYLRRAKVAVAPLRAGSGSPTKLIEAAAAGAAVVAPPWATASLGMTAPTAETDDEFVLAVERLLNDEEERTACAQNAAAALSAHGPAELAAQLEGVLAAAAS